MSTVSVSRWAMAIAVAAAALAGGCGKPGGFLITPVPADRTLEEKVIHSDGGPFLTDKIAVLDVSGVLTNAEGGGLFGTTDNPVALFAEQLDKAADDTAVKAVLLRINSPGGSVAASDIMHKAVLDFRKRRSDVIVAACIEDFGASGGYYLACAAPKIYALPSSITGSIGVIFQTFSIAGTLTKIGVKTEAIKSGPAKDMASPLHDLTDEERALLTQVIHEFYEQFLGAVLAGRPKLTREKLLPLADGRVFTGPQALEAGLVDELRYPHEILPILKTEAKLSRVKVVMYHRPLGYKANIYSRTAAPVPAAGPTVNLVNVNLADVFGDRQPKFLYLWTMP